MNKKTIPKIITDANGIDWYEKDAKHYIRISSVLESVVSKADRRFLLHCANEKHYEEILQNAGGIGSRVHEHINAWYKDKTEPDIDPMCDQELNAWKAFVSVRDEFEPITLEKTVFSDLYGFAGTFDFYGTHKKYGARLVDWKTGQFRFQAQYQVGAYVLAGEECQEIPEGTKSMLMYLNKLTGKAKPMSHQHMDFLKEGFLCILGTHKSLNIKAYEKMNHPWVYENPMYEYTCRKEGLRPEPRKEQQ